MKQVLFLLAIWIPYSGCKKPEQIVAEPEKIHEINIGILGGTVDANTHIHDWHFHHYWHLDLLTDTFLVKENPAMMGDTARSILIGGKMNFSTEPIVQKFLAQVNNMEDGAKYFQKSNGGLYCFPTHILQYRKDKSTKIIFFNVNKYVFGELSDFIRTLDNKGQRLPISLSKKLLDDSFAVALSKRTDFDSFAPAPLLLNGKFKIFTPPLNIENSN